jgi:succinylglutamic semialdehyde dehydrogenase
MTDSLAAIEAGLLDGPPADFIGGRFQSLASGDGIRSCDPADPERVVWSANPEPRHVDDAIAAARAAQPAWFALGTEARAAALGRWKVAAEARRERLAALITLETGKIRSEADAEAGLVATKVDITLGPHSSGRIAGYEVAAGPSKVGRCVFKPHGVMAVLGPFNFPAHLPNGHIVPALLAGNTVVFKPSDKTPAVGQAMAEIAAAADLPPGVVNVVQGAAGPAAALASHEGVDGVLFTGSWPVGRRILEANLDHPGRIVALELGGSNPTVVMPDADLRQAVVECARAAFATTGQRCTCTRRIVLHKDIADRFIPAFCKVASTLVVGPGESNDPVFMGPMISAAAVDAVMTFQDELHARGGKVLVQASRVDRPGHFVTPGVVLVDRFEVEHDRECFGPLVQLAIADDLDDCIAQANATRYGLAAAIFTRDDAVWERFLAECRSGCINRNTGTAGASGQLPFGGLGNSGNHRPAGAFSVDYCAYPVASMVESSDAAAIPPGMLLQEDWLD